MKYLPLMIMLADVQKAIKNGDIQEATKLQIKVQILRSDLLPAQN